MIEIKKLGRIDIELNELWQTGGAITPTPYLLNEDVIRIFTGFRDSDGISRIGYVDVEANNPKRVLSISREPVLDIGSDGCFDDNGMILGDIKRVGSDLYMFYVGFQLVKKAKFLAFTGLAISKDNGNSFIRYSKAPILDRADNARTIKAIHSINEVDGELFAYYAVGDGWECIDGKTYPQYEIYCSQMDWDTMSFSDEVKCVSIVGAEYRIGKPTVYKTKGGYIMFYTRGRNNDLSYYEPGVAISEDGIHWQREDNLCPCLTGKDGWDGTNTAYPRIVENAQGEQYLFYSGNGMGADGFGVARIVGGKVFFSQSI